MQEPKNTVSTFISLSGVPAVKPMYSSARSAAPRSSALAISAGFGTDAVNGKPWPGLVPQVTKGANSSAFKFTSTSKIASESVVKVFQ